MIGHCSTYGECPCRQQPDGSVLPPKPRCTDYDEDCAEVENKAHCWLHDPAKGFCPYLTPDTA